MTSLKKNIYSPVKIKLFPLLIYYFGFLFLSVGMSLFFFLFLTFFRSSAITCNNDSFDRLSNIFSTFWRVVAKSVRSLMYRGADKSLAQAD